MWRKVLATVFLLLIFVIAALLLGAEKLVSSVAFRALDASGLVLSYDHLELKPLGGTLVVSNLVLTDETGHKPLLSIDRARLEIVTTELLFGDNSAGALDAQGIDVYFNLDAAGESGSSWEPGTWLRYRKLLPGNASIENLSLHWRGDDPQSVTEISSLRARPGEGKKNQLRLVAEAVHRGADLHIEANIDTVEELDGGLSRVGLQFESTSQLLGTHWAADGIVEGSRENLHYSLQTGMNSKDIQGPLQRFNVDLDLNGITRIDGRLEGDLNGFSLTVAELSLDYSPEYRFSGDGHFEYDFKGDSTLDLAMEGELAKMRNLISWLDIDVAELGAASARVKIQGSLDDLLLRDAVITTSNERGLQVKLSGNVRLNNLEKNTLGDERGIDVVVSAPDLAALQAWTGKLDFETGPLRLSAHLRELDGHVLIRDVELNAEGSAGAKLSVQGQIADAGSLVAGEVAGVKGIDLKASFSSPSSQQLTDLVGQDLPNLGPVTASAAISGSADALRVGAITAQTGADGLRIQLQQGSVQVALAPAFSYSELQAPVSVELDGTSRLSNWIDRPFPDLGKVNAAFTVRQTAAGFGLPALTVELRDGQTVIADYRGSLQELAPLEGLTLEASLNGLPMAQLLETFARDVTAELNAGKLHGKYRISSVGEGFRITGIDIENRGSEQVKFLLKGSVQGSVGHVDMDLHLNTAVTDTQLLREVTGLQLGALSGDLQISGSGKSIRVTGNTRLGTTELVSRLFFTIDDDGLADLKGSITSPRLKPRDVGLGRLINLEEAAPQEQVAGKDVLKPGRAGEDSASGYLDRELPLDALPGFPIDLILAAAEIEGDVFSAEKFSVHIRAGAGRYELTDLLLNYTGGSVQMNAALDMRVDLPLWTVNAQLNDFHIERLRDLGAPGDVTGNINTLIRLQTNGTTPRQLVEKLDGDVAAAVEDLVLVGRAYDRLAVDTLAWFYTGGVLEQETRFSCVMGLFDLQRGIATSSFLYAESDYLVATGDASINLPAAELEMAITPRSKQRSFQIPGTIKVSGPFDNIDIDTAAVSTAVDTSAQVALFVPSVALHIFNRTGGLFDRDGDQKDKQEQHLGKCPQTLTQ